MWHRLPACVFTGVGAGATSVRVEACCARRPSDQPLQTFARVLTPTAKAMGHPSERRRMPPPLIIDTRSMDLKETLLSRERIYRDILPQRHEFELLDGVCYLDLKCHKLISYCDIREDPWWARGHVPGRPLMPGVLMLEAAAQTATIGAALEDLEAYKQKGFMGFGGVDQCKFRDAIVPPARLYVLAVCVENRPRRFVCLTQGIADGRMVFEAKITGIVMA